MWRQHSAVRWILGWCTECAVVVGQMTAYANGTNSVKKNYALGRMAWELPYVMPDNLTVYGGDDGDNTMMIMFKVIKPDLACHSIVFTWSQSLSLCVQWLI